MPAIEVDAGEEVTLETRDANDQHRGTEHDERRWKRDMHRVTVSDIGNTLESSAR